MLVKSIYDANLIVPSDDLSVSINLISDGYIELPLAKYITRNVKPGNIVVDIGANVGFFTVLLGAQVGATGKVYAYEANPYIFKYLSDNISLNYLQGCVKLENKAIYSETKKISFSVCNRYMGNSSIHKHDSSYFENYIDECETIEVDAIALEDQLSHVSNIDLLKIDIEGGELHAFKGFENMIKDNKIKTIVFELNKEMLQNDWDEFIELLRKYENNYGKQFYSLTVDGIEEKRNLNEFIAIGGYPYIVLK
jgi:methyltransferase, FkbM family